MILKDEQIEQKIPIIWREFIKFIVRNIKNRALVVYYQNDFEYSVDKEAIEFIYEFIDRQSDNIDELSDQSWDTSICRWMGYYWNVIVDLSTVETGLSDIVLFIDVYEHGTTYKFKLRSMHIP